MSYAPCARIIVLPHILLSLRKCDLMCYPLWVDSVVQLLAAMLHV